VEKNLENLGHRIKGILKESLGKIIGDAKLASDGATERNAGEVKNASGAEGARIFDVDADRVLGVGHQLKGALKQGLGNLVGNPQLAAEGVAEGLDGRTQNAAGSARDEKREAFAQTFTAIDALSQTDVDAAIEKDIAEAKQKEIDAANLATAERDGAGHAAL
jgi:uncharacterized protein YjbJ (UPF0337 family)